MIDTAAELGHFEILLTLMIISKMIIQVIEIEFSLKTFRDQIYNPILVILTGKNKPEKRDEVIFSRGHIRFRKE